MKDRTSISRHRTIWTMAAPKTSPSSPRLTWRIWRSTITLGRIRAATPHPEGWQTRGCDIFFVCFPLGWEGGGGGHLVLASGQKSQNCRTLYRKTADCWDALPGFLLPRCYQRWWTVKTAWSSRLLLGITANSKTLTGWWSDLYVLCMYLLFKQKKKKKKTGKKSLRCRSISYIWCDRHLLTFFSYPPPTYALIVFFFFKLFYLIISFFLDW